jgi:hypothetical protein
VKNAAEQKAPKRFEEYRWTPLNATPREILMEIKKDLTYKKHLPMTGTPHAYNAHKYCSYHGSYGPLDRFLHNIEGAD